MARPGVASTCRSSGANTQPATAVTAEIARNSPVAAPITLRAAAMSRRPRLCPISMVAAMPKPNTPADIRNMMMPTLEVAASASSPMKWPIHTALIEPFSDCSTLEASVGNAKAISVRPIGPVVRSRRPGGRGARVGDSVGLSGEDGITPV